MWERLMRSKGFWIGFSLSASAPIRLPRSALLPFRAVYGLYTVCHKGRGLFQGHGPGGFLTSSRAGMTRLSMSLKLKMNTAAQNMEFERAVSTGSDPGHRDPTDQTAGHGQGFAEPGCLWHYVDKGWMCVGLLCPSGQAGLSATSIFPILQWSRRGFLDLCGTVLSGEIPPDPQWTWSPQDIDEERSRPLWIPRSPSLSVGRRSSWSIWPSRMRVSLEQKFNLLEKSMERPKVLLKNLGKLPQIPTPCAHWVLWQLQHHGDQSGLSHGGLC